ncbi:MAG TPA: type II toxin-antitoxin system VapC family toxin [Thermoanaerobaculia bacterium]|nr:type II toxin-antitoxin system VapC family toxin [Thermoanaerobaculia bacterium]
MARLVLDASAAVRLIRAAELEEELLRRLEDAALVVTPDLFCSEVGNALWKYVRAGELSVEEATARLEQALNLTDLMVPDSQLIAEALVAAATYQHPVYDMMYAVLARRHGATVITVDRAFASRLKEMKVGVFCPVPG